MRLDSTRARDARERHAAGATRKELAATFGVSVSTITDVLRGRSHAEAGGPIAPAGTPGRRTEISDETVRAIREEYAAGAPQGELARRYGVSGASVSSFVRGSSRAAAGGPITPRREGMAALLSDERVRELRESYNGGVKQAKLAELFGISQPAVSSLVRGLARVEAGGPIASWKPRTPRTILSDEDRGEIVSMRADGHTIAELAAEFMVAPPTIRRVLTDAEQGR